MNTPSTVNSALPAQKRTDKINTFTSIEKYSTTAQVAFIAAAILGGASLFFGAPVFGLALASSSSCLALASRDVKKLFHCLKKEVDSPEGYMFAMFDQNSSPRTVDEMNDLIKIKDRLLGFQSPLGRFCLNICSDISLSILEMVVIAESKKDSVVTTSDGIRRAFTRLCGAAKDFSSLTALFGASVVTFGATGLVFSSVLPGLLVLPLALGCAKLARKINNKILALSAAAGTGFICFGGAAVGSVAVIAIGSAVLALSYDLKQFSINAAHIVEKMEAETLLKMTQLTPEVMKSLADFQKPAQESLTPIGPFVVKKGYAFLARE